MRTVLENETGTHFAVGGDRVNRRGDWPHSEALRKRVRQKEIYTGWRGGLTSEERARMGELEREVQELRRANEILRKASAFFAQAKLGLRPKE